MGQCRSVIPPGTLPLTFRVEGIEPGGKEWAEATPDERREFWKIAGRIASEVKQRELRAGLDYAGRRMKPVKPRKARYRSGARLDGDPLMPHRALSRTRQLLRHVVTAAGLTFYWAAGWGRILDYHRRGACLMRNGRSVGRLPVRNVFGISPEGRKEIARRARSAWLAGVMPETQDGLINPGGLSVDLPFDPKRRVSFDRERYLAPGVRLVRSKATTRDVNPETGIEGAASGNYRIQIDWKKRRRFAR